MSEKDPYDRDDNFDTETYFPEDYSSSGAETYSPQLKYCTHKGDPSSCLYEKVVGHMKTSYSKSDNQCPDCGCYSLEDLY